MTPLLLLRRFLLIGATLAACSSSLLAQNLGNCYHVPDSAELGGTHMRNPEFEIGPSTVVTIYSGNQFQGSGNPGNQTGGNLYYKAASATSWTSVGLGFDSQNGNNKYFRASFNTSSFGADDVIQYYLEIFYSDHSTTYVYGGDNITQTTGTQATAQASPFTIRNRPAFIFHSDNRVINGTSVQFWTKVGYIGKDATPASQYVNQGALYYTTDGSTPTGALGVASGTTHVVSLGLDHLDNDGSIAGNDMWWLGTVNNLPTFTSIKYKIGLWNSANNEEKFADYNTSGNNAAIFSFSIGTVGDPTLTVNSVSADYTTTHVFVNEITSDSIPLSISFNPNAANVDPATVQVYTNLNRRDYASEQYIDSYGIQTEEGIEPPSGDVVGTDDGHYYKAYAMSAAGGGSYSLTLQAQKTGAYRLTARYKLLSGGSWIYYTQNGRRDHAIVVSPTQSRDVQLYELNALNVDASGDQPSQRSTFADLASGNKRWNLTYLKNLGCNWVWFQPIHPNGIDGRQIDPNTSSAFTVGSPYAVKNFFEIMPLMGNVANFAGSTDPNSNDPNPVAPTDPSYATSPRGRAKADFASFMSAADTAGVGVMLDAPFNHTSFDAEMGANGVALLSPSSGANYTSQIRNTEARFFSQNGNYAARASGASNIALAPDRGDFGKFDDVHDIYFGTYSALVDVNNADNGNYLNEADKFFGYLGNSAYPNGDANWNSTDFTNNGVKSNITRNVWHYFGQYVPYWLGQTGHGDGSGNPYGNSTNADPAARLAADSKGIDGLRADFGQGLPPQCWEYIINVARSYKWNFVFMTESLDGGQVTYRSNRHFDILNENIVFPFQSASVAQDYRNIFDQRRAAYGQGLTLMNSTSHDEENYADPFQALIRYMVSGTVDGVPMIFYGQENGISQTFGFDHYETNFGKQIAHFKVFNSLGPILGNQTFGLQQLYPVFASVGQGRAFSPALRSSNRYYLNQTDGSIQNEIFSIAKYQTANTSPGTSDVVFGFVNLDRNNTQAGNYNVNITQNGSNLFGINAGRTYNVKNIAAYLGQDPTRRNTWLIPGNVSGANLLANGLFVSLNPVPTTNAGWTSAPFEAQYLKLYDVTPPPTDTAPTIVGTTVDNTATFNWATVTDNLGGVAGYRLQVSTDPAGNNVIFNQIVGNVTSYTITTATPGQTLYAHVDAVNNAGIEASLSPASTGAKVLESLTYWQSHFSITDLTAIPFNDGTTNLIKYLCDINPTTPMSTSDRAALPTVGSDTTTLAGTTYLTITYRSFALQTGITTNVQTSTDLTNWTTVTPDIVKQTGTDSGTGDPIMQDEVKVTGPKLFIRLYVTHP